MAVFIPNFVCAHERSDTSLVERVFHYGEQSLQRVDSQSVNAYTKCTYRTERRNFTLMAVPSMYEISQGRRNYIDEAYSRITFYADKKMRMQRQYLSSTIPHYRHSLPTITPYLMVRIYDMTLLPGFLLSPFHRSNRKLYRYKTLDTGNTWQRLTFQPKINNTQLVKGYAIVDKRTGKVERTVIDGEYDMIHFHINTEHGERVMSSLIPERSTINGTFTFLGNKLSFKYIGDFTCPTTFPDSIDGVRDPRKMRELRTDSLTDFEKELYKEVEPKEEPAKETDTVKTEQKQFKIPWEDIGDQLISSIRGRNKNGEFRISPIVNPQYIGYSPSRGLSYKMRVSGEYRIKNQQTNKFSTNSTLGYNFKQRLFYFTAPMQYHYLPDWKGYVELSIGNGNRISHNSIENEIKDEFPDSIEAMKDRDLTTFNDFHVSLTNHYSRHDWLSIDFGAIFHRRKAVKSADLRRFGKPDTYYSFAPMAEVKLTPFKGAPLLTINYERGITRLFGSNMSYGKVEADASWIKNFARLEQISVRAGGGFYTEKHNVYFVDYNKFRSNNLPNGWDDDWSGQFQLLDNQWYNVSPYYLRANFTFEAPMLFLSWAPIAGHYVELERIYASTVSLAHTRPYFELGYGFTCRAFSLACFASFLNTRFKKFGIEMTFELFHHW